jgi:hypothetical protein
VRPFTSFFKLYAPGHFDCNLNLENRGLLLRHFNYEASLQYNTIQLKFDIALFTMVTKGVCALRSAHTPRRRNCNCTAEQL